MNITGSRPLSDTVSQQRDVDVIPRTVRSRGNKLAEPPAGAVRVLVAHIGGRTSGQAECTYSKCARVVRRGCALRRVG